jgi:hypothetical protein
MIDIIKAQSRKNAAQDSSLDREHEEWKSKAIQLIIEVATRERFFIVDSVRQLAIESGVGEPAHYGVWGAIFREAARRKIIEKTYRYKPSRWKMNNMGLRNVWKSLLIANQMDSDGRLSSGRSDSVDSDF